MLIAQLCSLTADVFCLLPAYQLAKPSDSQRKEMLLGSLAKPNHPMSKFCWGKSNMLKAAVV